LPALIGARFTPGTRMPTFLASGFLKIPFWRYFSVIVCVAAVWTTSVFAIIYYFGPVVAKAIGKDAWMVGLTIVIVAFVIPLYFRRRAKRKQAQAAETGTGDGS
jgi:membrane protein DedA with SNARE-associated domain